MKLPYHPKCYYSFGMPWDTEKGQPRAVKKVTQNDIRPPHPGTLGCNTFGILSGGKQEPLAIDAI